MRKATKRKRNSNLSLHRPKRKKVENYQFEIEVTDIVSEENETIEINKEQNEIVTPKQGIPSLAIGAPTQTKGTKCRELFEKNYDLFAKKAYHEIRKVLPDI